MARKNLTIIAGRVITITLFIAIMAGTWDVWWHGVVGRDTFWEPPHMLLYGSVLFAITYGIYVWYHTRELLWRRLAMVLALIPLSGPFDELWHRLYGVELVNSPLIVWSPPHVVLVLALAGSFVMLLPIIRADKDLFARRLLSSMAFAGIANVFLFLVTPLQPSSSYNLIGFWGAGFVAVIYIGVMIVAQRWMKGFARATTVTIFIIFLSAMSFGEVISPEADVEPHDHPPGWLTIFALMVPALYLDLTRRILWLRAGVASLLWAGLLYGFSSMFFEVQFQYSVLDAVTAIFASLLGGLLIGVVLSRYFRK